VAIGLFKFSPSYVICLLIYVNLKMFLQVNIDSSTAGDIGRRSYCVCHNLLHDLSRVHALYIYIYICVFLGRI
jgi:hypothetical protein